jgi:pimeloyl-ACP methyl ester carboxylesterase
MGRSRKGHVQDQGTAQPHQSRDGEAALCAVKARSTADGWRGPQDAGVFTEIAELLSDRYTVVTSDPRGNSRSRFDGRVVDLDVDLHADDAAAIIRVVNNGPAYVFGTSGGAQIGLNLAVRHPDLVQALVAHEPPSMMLLDDPEPALAEDRALQETYRTKGVEAAMAEFFAMAGFGGDDEAGEAPAGFEMTPEAAATFERVSGNFEYWLAHSMIPLSTYVPEAEKLKTGVPPVVVAIGEASAGQGIEAMGLALTRKLGVEATRFPGDHLGFETEAAAFSEALHTAFLTQ